MPLRSHPIRITILFDAADYRIFVSATRQLRRIMGRNAPDVTALIVFNLQDRDATGLADDYLDAIRWPSSAGRVVTLRTHKTGMPWLVSAEDDVNRFVDLVLRSAEQ